MLGGAQYMEQLTAAQVDLEALAQGIEHGGVKLWGLQGEIDRLNRELAALGAVNLAALDELTRLARAQDLPRRAERRPAWRR